MAQLNAQVDKLLTSVSSAYIPTGYVSESLLPNIPVKQTTGKLGKYSNQHLRIVNTLMAGRGEAPRYQTIVRSDTTYDIERNGLEGLVTPDDKANVEQPFDAEKDETIGLTTVIWLGKEKALADTLTDPAIITQTVQLSGTAQYNDFTNSDPIGDFLTARNTIRAAAGMPPDTAVMDWEVAQTLAYSPKILSALGFTQNRAGQLSEQELAKAMGVPRLLIAMPLFNSAQEGQADSLQSVWGKHVVFLVAPKKAVKYQVSAGYYITQIGKSPRKVFKAQLHNPPETTSIIVQDAYDFLISNAAAAFLIEDAIA